MQFLRASRRKIRRFFPAQQNFFLVLYMIVCQSALISKNSPAPESTGYAPDYMALYLKNLDVKLLFKQGS